MQQYLKLVENILDTGIRQSNRTGVDTLFIPGAMLQFDLRQGFPALTTKTLNLKAVIGELCGFLRGCTSAAEFRALGCNVWNANANSHGVRPNAWLDNPQRKGQDDLGRIYGAQWRDWRGALMEQDVDSSCASQRVKFNTDGKSFPYYDASVYHERVDQLATVLRTLQTDPTSRRIIISAWRPDELDAMALPPCHVLYQFIADVGRRELHLCMYQRSGDVGLGVPFNIASASLFLTAMAAVAGFVPATFTHFIADAHIYVNHIDGLKRQIGRTPRESPTLLYTGPKYEGQPLEVSAFDQIEPHHFTLVNYNPMPHIPLEMAT